MRQSRHFLFCVLFPANCDAGHYFNKTMGECRPCGIGFYQNLTGQDFCHECPMGQATRMDNSTTCNDCYCEYHVSLPITQRCAKQTTLHSLGSCTENIPDSKVLRANMGPTWAGRIQVVPMLAHELCYLGSQWYRFHPFYLSIPPVLLHKWQRVFSSCCTSARHAGRFDCLMSSLILVTMDNGRGLCVWWQSCKIPYQTHRGIENWKMYAIKEIKIRAEYGDMLPRLALWDRCGTLLIQMTQHAKIVPWITIILSLCPIPLTPLWCVKLAWQLPLKDRRKSLIVCLP